MTCEACAGAAIRAESLQRRLDTVIDDIAELEAERAGLLAEIARLKDRNYALAMQITGVVP